MSKTFNISFDTNIKSVIDEINQHKHDKITLDRNYIF
jgi:hypothetical protein